MSDRVLQPLTLVTASSSDLSKLQSNIVQYLEQLDFLPELAGRLVSDVNLTSGQNNAIAHQLGRRPVGWKIVDIDTNTNVWKSSDSTVQYLYLDCGSNCTVSLVVF